MAGWAGVRRQFDDKAVSRPLAWPKRKPFYPFTLDDLDELARYVAAEANHAKVKKLEKELHQLYGRIADVLESYTDEPDESAP